MKLDTGTIKECKRTTQYNIQYELLIIAYAYVLSDFTWVVGNLAFRNIQETDSYENQLIICQECKSADGMKRHTIIHKSKSNEKNMSTFFATRFLKVLLN